MVSYNYTIIILAGVMLLQILKLFADVAATIAMLIDIFIPQP